MRQPSWSELAVVGLRMTDPCCIDLIGPPQPFYACSYPCYTCRCDNKKRTVPHVMDNTYHAITKYKPELSEVHILIKHVLYSGFIGYY